MCSESNKITNVSTPILSGEFPLAARRFFFKFCFCLVCPFSGHIPSAFCLPLAPYWAPVPPVFFTDRFLCWRCVRPVAGPCPCPCPCLFVRLHTRNGTTYLHFIGRHFSEYTHRKLINEPGIRRMLMMFEWLCRRSMASHGHGHGVLKMQK